MLQKAGYTPVEVPDGRAARAHIETQGLPALVILDLMRPAMDGWQFLRSWRHHPASRRTPILVLADAGLLTAEDAPPLGVNGLLYKSVDPLAVCAVACLLMRGFRAAAPH